MQDGIAIIPGTMAGWTLDRPRTIENRRRILLFRLQEPSERAPRAGDRCPLPACQPMDLGDRDLPANIGHKQEEEQQAMTCKSGAKPLPTTLPPIPPSIGSKAS